MRSVSSVMCMGPVCCSWVFVRVSMNVDFSSPVRWIFLMCDMLRYEWRAPPMVCEVLDRLVVVRVT